MEDTKKYDVIIYTDGACSGNPGPGGWGAVLIYGDNKKELSGGKKETTNNEMELTAVLMALKELKKSCNVELFSDSAYVVNGFTEGWIESWIKNGWKNSKKEEVKNKELWQDILNLTTIHKVNFNKVKGHANVELNERCDELARNAIPN